jgi:hypothetical protein
MVLMRAKHAWLLVPILTLVAWLLLRGHRDTTAQRQPVSNPIAADHGAPAPDIDPPTVAPARPGPSPSAPPSTRDTAGTPTPAPAPTPPGSHVPAADRPGLASSTASVPAPAPEADDAPAGKFTDKTGWSDHSVAQQLNREFMPLASECIDQAKGRKPFLNGLLSFTMVISPTTEGKAVVSSLKVRPDNKIEDPELWTCIRESSFALEGLTAPHDFDISMPIKRDDNG